MGAGSSKAARSLPKSASSANTGAGSRVGGGGAAAPPPSSRPQPPPQPQVHAQDGGRNPGSIPVGSDTLQSAESLGDYGRKASPVSRDPTVGPVPGRSEGGSEDKDDAVMKDAFDPHFVGQLRDIGPVDVPQFGHNNLSRQRAAQPSQMSRILKARQEREEALEAERQRQSSSSGSGSKQESLRPTPSGALSSSSFDVNTLTMLMDERKSVKTLQDMKRLAIGYDVEADKLESLCRRFNSPSVGPKLDSPEQEQAKREGNDPLPPRLLAVWTDPDLTEETKRVQGPSS